GTFNNMGSVWLNEGQFRVANLSNSGTMDFTGNTNVAVTQSFNSPGSLYFFANDLSITHQAGDLDVQSAWISAANMNLSALNGSVLFDYLDASAGESGRTAGGNVTINASGHVSGWSIDASGGNLGEGAPGAGGQVSVTAGGDITIQDGIYATGAGGSSDGDGGKGGKVSLVSGGNTSVGYIEVYGGDTFRMSGSGGAGGEVRIRAGGAVDAGWLIAAGGYGEDVASTGGRGGLVDIEAGHSLQTFFVVARGGGGGYEGGGAGGAGGDIRLVQRSGDLVLSNSYVDAGGGEGGSSLAVAGKGGDGGRITVEAQGGGVVIDAYQPMDSGYTEGPELGVLTAEGGYGGYGDGGEGGGGAARGGQGGHGGAIDIRAAGNSRLLGRMDASGGWGGYVDGTVALGGQGGNGGAVRIEVTGAGATLQLAGDVHAAGGGGGEAYPSYESYDVDPARSGPVGTTGTVRTAAAGGIVVPSTVQVAELSPPLGSEPQLMMELPTEPPPPGSIVPGELRIDAQWTNSSPLAIQSGAMVMTTGTLLNEGSIDIASGATLALGNYDHYSDTFQPGGVTLLNAPAGTIQGSGLIHGHLDNAGTVAPGTASGGIGALTVTGNFSQRATGVLLADIAANTTFVPGVTYDQLVVHGSATLGGQLKVAAVPEVAAPSSSLLVASATQLAATSALPTASYELLSAASAGGEFALISGPPELVSQIRMNVGGTAVPVPGFTALPSPSSPLVGTGLIAAIQEVLPGVSLEQIQQVVTESQNNAIGERRQRRDEDEGRPEGSADIVVTDTACQPG
ncbi:MAG TPA: hypothetical protein VEC03_15010, partial [Ramlibacter sp.]|nr:hypothetical protein [Ramlibacter sp.]